MLRLFYYVINCDRPVSVLYLGWDPACVFFRMRWRCKILEILDMIIAVHIFLMVSSRHIGGSLSIGTCES